jgi:hypothetical protein
MRRCANVRHSGRSCEDEPRSIVVAPSDFQLVAAFQVEDFASFVRRRHFG